MVDPAEIEVELAGLSVHQLLVKLFTEVRTNNGSCREHRERTEADMYGDPDHQIIGLKGVVQDLATYADRARLIIRVLIAAVGVLGAANIVELIKAWVGG